VRLTLAALVRLLNASFINLMIATSTFHTFRKVRLMQLLQIRVGRGSIGGLFSNLLLTVRVLVLILDLLDISKTAPRMLRLVQSDLGAQVGLEESKIAVLHARDGHEVLEELHTPVARVILRLVLDVVAALAIPCAHADILGNDVDGV
tara:strand:+ start:7174 stop:7617 length:444 start_codon:yes stop_codon:yes gene_type:complete